MMRWFLPLCLCIEGILAQSGPYYGLPLGSFHYSRSNTDGAVYAADPTTLMVVNFHHHARPGCTAFMAGPAVPEVNADKSKKGNGVLLPVKYHLLPSSLEITEKRRRNKRNSFTPRLSVLNPNFHPFDWPFEFGNLRVEETANSFDSAPRQQDPFAGIEIDVGSGEGFNFEETTPQSTTSIQSTTAAPETTQPTEQPVIPEQLLAAQNLADQRAAVEIPRAQPVTEAPDTATNETEEVDGETQGPQETQEILNDTLTTLSPSASSLETSSLAFKLSLDSEPELKVVALPLDQEKIKGILLNEYKQDAEHPDRPTQWELQQERYEQWFIDQQKDFEAKYKNFGTTTEQPQDQEGTTSASWWHPAWADPSAEPRTLPPLVETTTENLFIHWNQEESQVTNTEQFNPSPDRQSEYPDWARGSQYPDYSEGAAFTNYPNYDGPNNPDSQGLGRQPIQGFNPSPLVGATNQFPQVQPQQPEPARHSFADYTAESSAAQYLDYQAAPSTSSEVFAQSPQELPNFPSSPEVVEFKQELPVNREDSRELQENVAPSVVEPIGNTDYMAYHSPDDVEYPGLEYPSWAADDEQDPDVPYWAQQTTTKRPVRQALESREQFWLNQAAPEVEEQFINAEVNAPAPRTQRIRPVIQAPDNILLLPAGGSSAPLVRSEAPQINPDSKYKFVPAPRPPRIRSDGSLIATEAPAVGDGIQWGGASAVGDGIQWGGARASRPAEKVASHPNPESKYKFVVDPRPPRIRPDGSFVATEAPVVGDGILWGDESGSSPVENTRFSPRRRGSIRNSATRAPHIGQGARWFNGEETIPLEPVSSAPEASARRRGWGPLPREPTIFLGVGPDGKIHSMKESEVEKTDTFRPADRLETGRRQEGRSYGLPPGDTHANGGYTIRFGQEPEPTPAPRRSSRRRGPLGPPSPRRRVDRVVNQRRRRPPGDRFGFGGRPGNAAPGSDGLVFRLGDPAEEQSLDTFEGENFHSFRIGESEPNRRFTTPRPSGSTPLFYVVEDLPRVSGSENSQNIAETSGSRRRAPRIRQRPRNTNFDSLGENAVDTRFEPTEAPLRYVAPVGTTPAFPPARHGETFALTDSDGDSLIIKLRPEYTLNDFKWFGVYDHCENFRTAFVSLDGVVPPQETAIGGIKGWQYNAGSQAIIVMNCNTLLLKNFSFDGSQAEAHIYVGVGEFPNNIASQVKAYIVGTVPARRLTDYNQEDVIVRLPPGWKTFDINFISIYNPEARISYGHATIPPVIVPPCEDLYQ